MITPYRALTLAAAALDDSRRNGPAAGFTPDFCAELHEARDHILALRDTDSNFSAPLRASAVKSSSLNPQPSSLP